MQSYMLTICHGSLLDNSSTRSTARQLLTARQQLNTLDSSTAFSTARQLLDSSTGRHMESASTGLDGARQELDRLDRQGLDNGLDSGSTEPRQLDSSTARAQEHDLFEFVRRHLR